MTGHGVAQEGTLLPPAPRHRKRATTIHSLDQPPKFGRPAPAQVCLGLFVVGQLLFIVGANVVPLLRLESWRPAEEPGGRTALAGVRGAAHDTVRSLDDLATRWAHLTGQWQGWALYSGVARQATFLCVDVCCDGAAPVRLLSAGEPENPARYFRPFLTSRLGGYEFYLIAALVNWDDDAVARDPAAWRRGMADHLRDRWPALRAYLGWQLRRFRQEHPGHEPRHLILSVRRYRTPGPNDSPGVWVGPSERPLLRWQPGAAAVPGCLPVELCDPVTGRFAPLPREEATAP